jgi:hypothetical protein
MTHSKIWAYKYADKWWRLSYRPEAAGYGKAKGLSVENAVALAGVTLSISTFEYNN